MNCPISKTLALFGLLVSSAAMAQNNPSNTSVTSQITMTRGYTQSILTKIGSVPADRFNESTDFSKVGPVVKSYMEKTLTDFRNAMEILLVGSLTDSLTSYNETFLDTKLPDAEKQQMLGLQRKVLQQQILSASAVYQNEIKRLYQTLPQLNLIRFTSNRAKGYAEFEDGTLQFLYEWSKSKYAESQTSGWSENFLNTFNENYSPTKNEFVSTMYKNRFDAYLKSVCQTRICAAGLLQQLSSYVLYVDAYLNRDITLTLADGTSVQIQSLKGKAGSFPSMALSQTITNFAFDSSYSALPLKN